MRIKEIKPNFKLPIKNKKKKRMLSPAISDGNKDVKFSNIYPIKKESDNKLAKRINDFICYIGFLINQTLLGLVLIL
jgi:hypothetical protein